MTDTLNTKEEEGQKKDTEDTNMNPISDRAEENENADGRPKHDDPSEEEAEPTSDEPAS